MIRTDNHIREALLRDYPDLAQDDQCLQDTLDGASDFADQATAVIMSIRDDEALLDSISQLMGMLSARKERIERRVDRKRDLLMGAMVTTGRTKLELPIATVSVANKAPSVIITDETIIPPAYMTTPKPTPARPDKIAIKNALVNGTAVPGATLSNKAQTLMIRGA